MRACSARPRRRGGSGADPTRARLTLSSRGLPRWLLIGALALLGIVIGWGIGGLGPVLLGPLIAAQLPFPADFSLSPSALAEAAIYGGLTAFIFTLWPLARADRIRPAALFRDAFSGRNPLPAPR